MFERFVEVVNSQNEYNTNGVNAVPILIWHKIDNSNEEYSTSTTLFNAELKYLHDNGFTVLTMADLVYDDASKYLKISDSIDESSRAHKTTPNEFAARVTGPDTENASDDNPSTEEKADVIIEEAGEEENERTPPEDNPPVTKGNDDVDDDTISDDDARLQSNEDNEADEDTESQIPSSILRFILEP
jgi:hypothetical protein